MLTLYEFPVSPFCDKVRRILYVKRMPYHTEKVSLVATRGWYLRINPIGKVPTLVHDGRTIADSTAIAHYLESVFPTPSLLPEDATERALCQLLEDWADESLYFYQKRLKFSTSNNTKHWTPRFSAFDSPAARALLALVLPLRQARQLREQGLGRKPLAVVLDDIARLVASVDEIAARNDWLVGGALSLADIAVCVQLAGIGATPEGRRLLDAYPATVAWMSRVDAATVAPARPLPSVFGCAPAAAGSAPRTTGLST